MYAIDCIKDKQAICVIAKAIIPILEILVSLSTLLIRLVVVFVFLYQRRIHMNMRYHLGTPVAILGEISVVSFLITA